jgi:small subunit ribosomal protein S9
MVKDDKGLQYYEAVGRRKSAVARVRLYILGKNKLANVNGLKIKPGEIFVNDKLISDYFSSAVDRNIYLLPLKATSSVDRFAISIKVSGGGKKGQLGAIVHGISRALVLVDEANKKILRSLGLITRDPRVKERRKVGTGGKARREKQSPKR